MCAHSSKPEPKSARANRLPRKIGLLLGAVLAALLLVEGLARIYFAVSDAPLFVAYGTRSEMYRARWIEARQRRSRADGQEPLVHGMGRYHPRLGWVPIANLAKARVENRPPVSTNSRGLRSLREIPYAKPVGRRRLVAIGDSYTFGFDGEDEQIWPAVLEEALGGWEVVNLGVFGYGIDQQLIMFQDQGVRYEPDVVVVGFYEGDADRALLSFREFAKPRFELRDGELVLTQVPVPTPDEILARHAHRAPISYALHWWWQRSRGREAIREQASAQHRARRSSLVEAILQQMQREVRGCGARMLVMFIPDNAYAGSPSPVRDDLRAWSTQFGYAFLDLAPVLEALSEQEARSAFSGHFNPLGNVVAARALAEKLADLGWTEPLSAAAVRELDHRRARALEEELSSGKDLLSQAVLLQSKGRHEQAESLYRRALRLEPNQVDALSNLGVIVARRGRVDEAVGLFERALKIDPHHFDAHNNLGIVRMDAGRLDEATRHYRAALKIRPDDAGALDNLGLALMLEGELDEAVTSFRRALAIDPDLARAHADLAEALEAQGKLDEAARHRRRADELRYRQAR